LRPDYRLVFFRFLSIQLSGGREGMVEKIVVLAQAKHCDFVDREWAGFPQERII
jgi:hypothetical protein